MKKVSAEDFKRAVEKAFIGWQDARWQKIKLSNEISVNNAFKIEPHPMSATLRSLESRDEELKWDVLLLVGGLLDQFDSRSNRRARQRMNFLLGRKPRKPKRKLITDLENAFPKE